MVNLSGEGVVTLSWGAGGVMVTLSGGRGVIVTLSWGQGQLVHGSPSSEHNHRLKHTTENITFLRTTDMIGNKML